MLFREPTWSDIFSIFMGKRKSNKRPHAIHKGDVISVKGDFLNRYGIWTGKNFIQYAKNAAGKSIVHEIDFKDFCRGAESMAVCVFPKHYGHPKEKERLILEPSSVVMPQEKIWRLISWGIKARKYKVYSPEETIARAKSRLGDTGFTTSEHFAMWCKTGIAESHQLEKMREWRDLLIVY